MSLPQTTTYRDNNLPRVPASFFNTCDYLITYLNAPAGALTGAFLVGISDAGGYFPTKNVEAALQNLGAAIAASAITFIAGANITLTHGTGTLTIAFDGTGWVTLNTVQTVQNKVFTRDNTYHVTCGTNVGAADTFSMQDYSDITKSVYWNLTNIYSGTTCSVAFPVPAISGAGIVLVGANTFQNLANKGIDGNDNNTFANIPPNAIKGTGGTINYVLGINAAGTAGEAKHLIAGTHMNITYGAGAITLNADSGGVNSITANARPGSPVAGDIVYYTTNIGPSVAYGSGNFNTISEIYDGAAWHPLGLYFG